MNTQNYTESELNFYKNKGITYDSRGIWIATWFHLGVKKQKYFYINKYSDIGARNLALEFILSRKYKPYGINDEYYGLKPLARKRKEQHQNIARFVKDTYDIISEYMYERLSKLEKEKYIIDNKLVYKEYKYWCDWKNIDFVSITMFNLLNQYALLDSVKIKDNLYYICKKRTKPCEICNIDMSNKSRFTGTQGFVKNTSRIRSLQLCYECGDLLDNMNGKSNTCEIILDNQIFVLEKGFWSEDIEDYIFDQRYETCLNNDNSQIMNNWSSSDEADEDDEE